MSIAVSNPESFREGAQRRLYPLETSKKDKAQINSGENLRHR